MVWINCKFRCSRSRRNHFSNLQHLLIFKNIFLIVTLKCLMPIANSIVTPLISSSFPPSHFKRHSYCSNKQPKTLGDCYNGNRMAQRGERIQKGHCQLFQHYQISEWMAWFFYCASNLGMLSILFLCFIFYFFMQIAEMAMSTGLRSIKAFFIDT